MQIKFIWKRRNAEHFLECEFLFVIWYAKTILYRWQCGVQHKTNFLPFFLCLVYLVAVYICYLPPEVVYTRPIAYHEQLNFCMSIRWSMLLEVRIRIGDVELQLIGWGLHDICIVSISIICIWKQRIHNFKYLSIENSIYEHTHAFSGIVIAKTIVDCI